MADTESTSKTPWFKFWPADWQGDELLALASLAARGLLLELICLMHKALPYGYLLVHGKPPTDDELARLCRTRLSDIRRYRLELLERGILSITPEGLVYSRRLVRQHAKAAALSRNGKSGADARWQTDGKQDGHGHGKPHGKPDGKRDGPRSKKLEARNIDLRASDHEIPFDPDNSSDVLAAAFLERYPEVYARARDGGVYHITHAHYYRDLTYARELAGGWPDLDRLLNMLEVFLRRIDIGKMNKPGTPGQFLHMAPDCDALLKANGR